MLFVISFIVTGVYALIYFWDLLKDVLYRARFRPCHPCALCSKRISRIWLMHAISRKSYFEKCFIVKNDIKSGYFALQIHIACRLQILGSLKLLTRPSIGHHLPRNVRSLDEVHEQAVPCKFLSLSEASHRMWCTTNFRAMVLRGPFQSV